ncbi:MAG TPA: hypothetical protein VFL13_01990, partial [Candidatus Baltobacteraceae bacterium]|nr:hypothetical protein [Candidatus Baltobacteraceae bacterium]
GATRVTRGWSGGVRARHRWKIDIVSIFRSQKFSATTKEFGILPFAENSERAASAHPRRRHAFSL